MFTHNLASSCIFVNKICEVYCSLLKAHMNDVITVIEKAQRARGVLFLRVTHLSFDTARRLPRLGPIHTMSFLKPDFLLKAASKI